MLLKHLVFRLFQKACHSEPVRTLAWESASPDVRRNSLHSVSAVTVSAAKTAYPLLPSSSPNQSTGFDLEKENRGNGYGAGGPKPGCGMECARLDADCHTSDVGHWFAMTIHYTEHIIKPPAGIPGGRFRNVHLFLQILLQRLEGLVADVVLHAAGVVLGHLVAHADLL